MKHPRYYWLLYAAGLVVTAVALGWLTHVALALDRAEATARHQAEIEENVGRALWRMDVRLMPLIAAEAARPHFLYEPFYVPPAEPGQTEPLAPRPSPLLTQPSELVVLNFQVDPENQWTSAQIPAPEQHAEAVQCGVRPADIFRCASNLASLEKEVSYSNLLPQLPVTTVAEVWRRERSDSTGSQSVATVITPNSYIDAPNTQSFSNEPALQQAVRGGDFGQQAVEPRAARQRSISAADLANRGEKFQTLAQREFQSQRANYNFPSSGSAREGISRPVWIGSRLLLARRVELDGRTVIQGCWLDWPRIRELLIAEATDLLASVELQPVDNVAAARPNRMLATLPVQLVVPSVPAPATWTVMRTTLAIAWLCATMIAVSGGLLLHGVLSLSERRGAFVSAVTHELRTPLTTFRLYSEMLAKGMLPDESQRQKYLQTLHGEADRLARLVDNVLYYARLERGRAARHHQRINVRELLDRCQDRLSERAGQAGLQLVTDWPTESASWTVVTDASAVEQILFNLVDNAAKYAGRSPDRRLQLTAEHPPGRIAIRVRDHGPGVEPQMVRRLFQPFSKSAEDAANSAPGVGLGLALCRRLAREMGGQLSLEENSAEGATFLLTLPAA